jgi:CheY-like chemotaxis protein
MHGGSVEAVSEGEGHGSMAYSALSALADAQRLRPDAILLDLDLPGMSGYEVARRLRAQPELRATLLVALSVNQDDEAAARAAGFHRFLRKPIDIVALERVLA